MVTTALSCDMDQLIELVSNEDDNDNNNARALLGRNYFYGYQTGVNKDLGIKLLLWAAAEDKDLDVSLDKLQGASKEVCEDVLSKIWARGICYLEGIGKYSKNLDLAMENFTKAANLGYAPAQVSLGRGYEAGSKVDNVKKNPQTVVAWYEKAVEQDDAFGQNNLGMCYIKGYGVAKDANIAVDLFKKAADQGLAIAQFNLGVCYDNGQGVEKDGETAIGWYRKAVDQGHAKAQDRLGVCYDNDKKVDSVEKDKETTLKWVREQEAALLKHIRRHEGYGGAKDEKTVVDWYKKAADQGDVMAQFNLGVCYMNGKGIEKNQNIGIYWLKKSAYKGYARAQYELGVCYHNGEGVEKDEKTAFDLFTKAAYQWFLMAQYERRYLLDRMAQYERCYLLDRMAQYERRYLLDCMAPQYERRYLMDRMAQYEWRYLMDCMAQDDVLCYMVVAHDVLCCLMDRMAQNVLYYMVVAQNVLRYLMDLAQHELGVCYHNCEGVEDKNKEQTTACTLVAPGQGHAEEGIRLRSCKGKDKDSEPSTSGGATFFNTNSSASSSTTWKSTWGKSTDSHLTRGMPTSYNDDDSERCSTSCCDNILAKGWGTLKVGFNEVIRSMRI